MFQNVSRGKYCPQDPLGFAEVQFPDFVLTQFLCFGTNFVAFCINHNTKPFRTSENTVACIIVRRLLISVHKWQSSVMAATHEYWSQHDAHLVYLPIFHGLNLIIFL